MQVRIVSEMKTLAGLVRDRLEAAGHQVDWLDAPAARCGLDYAEGLDVEDLTRLVGQLKPLLPSVLVVPAVEAADAVLWLGDSRSLSAWDIKIHADSAPFAQALRGRFDTLGFTEDGLEIDAQSEDRLDFGGATPFARQVVKWVLHDVGVRVSENKRWGDSDDDLWIHVREPVDGDTDPCLRHPVVIEGDDYRQIFALKSALEAAGFTRVQTQSLDSENPRFTLHLGAFASHTQMRTRLQDTLQSFLEGEQVDPDRFPLQRVERKEPGAWIQLPMGAHAADTLRSYAGAYPDRWVIVVRTDRPAAVTALTEAFTEAGFAQIRIEPLAPDVLGFRIAWGAAAEQPEITQHIQGLVQATISAVDPTQSMPLHVSATLDETDPRILIDLPIADVGEGAIERRLKAACSKWECTIKTARLGEHAELVDAFEALNFEEFERETETDIGEALLKYGGAPPALVEYLGEMIFEHTGTRARLKKQWDDDDDDIWIYLPEEAQLEEQSADTLDLSDWFGATGPVRALVDIGEQFTRVADHRLPRRVGVRQDLVPPISSFSHYCLDRLTAQTLTHVAQSVVLREPCLLEGETSVSKTSIIQYLAMLLNQPLVRLNLNGQTDTGELVGRFVPREGADAEGAHPWRWQDGLVIEAMKHGWWVVLDELNLAEPQILERLNSVLERQPSLILTENDNSVIGPGGHPVHPNFRIFATMNPAEYAGRSPLSPAYRDRWRGYRYVPRPGEIEYRAMLGFLVTGQQPEVELLGQLWLGARQEPPLGALKQMPGVQGFLSALARFHATLEGAVGGATGQSARLGGGRRERYVFTRRGLLSVMDYLAHGVGEGDGVRHMRAALARYYLGRMTTTTDQAIVARLLDAAGIGPSTWAIDELAQDEDESP